MKRNATKQAREDFECSPVPAILLRYSDNDWDQAIEDYYRLHPYIRGQKIIVLMPNGWRLQK